jgi:hypothetical protein
MINEFDAIVACGCSYTQGERRKLNIGLNETWPGILAQELGVPFENLAISGADNYNIALQPYLHQKNTYSKPLYIFNFTVDYRLPVFSYRYFTMESLHSILPEHLADTVYPQHYENVINNLLERKVPNTTFKIRSHEIHSRSALYEEEINLFENEMIFLENEAIRNNDYVDGFQQLTKESIKQANRITSVIPNSQVIWGFIHADHSNRGDFRTRDIVEHTQFPFLDNCYNTYFDNKSLQEFIDEKKLWISQEDIHPNQEGIDLIALLMKQHILANLNKY